MSLVTDEPGLCLDCANSRQLRGARSTFWLCELSTTDPAFPRYPRLPVLSCRGYVKREQALDDPAGVEDP